MDDIKSLGTSLLTLRDSFGDKELIIFKADIKEAYHLMWMCPEWQAKQVVTVSIKRHVDFFNCFGSWVSYKVFLSFTSLIAWIVEHVRQIHNLTIYIDDNAVFGPARCVLYYEPYKHYFLTDQTKLLLLWDECKGNPCHFPCSPVISYIPCILPVCTPSPRPHSGVFPGNLETPECSG